MSNYAGNHQNILFSGQWAISQAPSSAGEPALCLRGNYSSLQFKATGTDCSIQLLKSTSVNLYVSVDGGAETLLTLPADNTWGSVNLFTGLSDSTHIIKIRQKGGSYKSLFVRITNGITILGSSPALLTIDDFGPVYDMLGGFLSGGKIEGAFYPLEEENYDNPVLIRPLSASQLASIRFKAKLTKLRLWGFYDGAKFFLTKDGVDVGSFTFSTDFATYDWVDLITGEDGITEKEYRIIYNGGGFGRFISIQTVGGSLSQYQYDDRPDIVGMGDSIMAGQGVNSDKRGCFLWQLCEAKNYNCVNMGESGDTLISIPGDRSGDNKFGVWSQKYLQSKTYPAYILIQYGYNDVNLSGYDYTNFQTYYLRTVQDINKAFPYSKILCVVPFQANTTNWNSINRPAIKTAIQNVVTAIAKTNVIFVDTDGMLDYTTGTDDGLHPNLIGNGTIKTGLLPYVDSYVPPSGGGSGPIPMIGSPLIRSNF